MGWVTELRDDPFVGPRIKFTLVNFIFIAIVFAWGSVIFGIVRNRELENSIRGKFNDAQLEETIIQKAREGLGEKMVLLFGSLGFGITVVSYFLAGMTLSPIKVILRAQKRFIADSSHELRTPLSIIKADSEVALLDGEDLKQSDAIAAIKSNLEEVDRMSKIIDNLLSLSYYDTTATEIPFEPVQLSELISNLVQKAQSFAQKKSVQLKMAEAKPLSVIGNATALEQMAMNLIRNAILYTPEGGSVTVSVGHKDKNTAQVTVQDTGIGISAKDLPYIMSPFYKGERSVSKEGSGLGLTIVKKIVDRHRGYINIQSEKGRGTAVMVSLPLA